VFILASLCTASAASSSAADVGSQTRAPSGDVMIAPVFVCLALFVAGWALGLSSDVLRLAIAQAQSAQANPVERARTAVETLINRLRGRDRPAGIEKANVQAER
jgi:hypothetical protein